MKRSPELSCRLLAVAETAERYAAERGGALRIADIGCDHALLPIWLLGRGCVSSAIASDVREGPLRRARENAESFGVTDRIRIVRGDGLQTLPDNGVDLITICGMGGELIAAILREGDVRRTGADCLVLLPHSREEVLRRFLRRGGFFLAGERLVREGRHFYPVLCARTVEGDAPDVYGACAALLCDTLSCTTEEAYDLAERFGPHLLLARDDMLYARLCMRKEALSQKIKRAEAADAFASPLLRLYGEITRVLDLWKGEGHAVQ